jgi:transcriptional regulator of acetoin/glycerol metabolism
MNLAFNVFREIEKETLIKLLCEHRGSVSLVASASHLTRQGVYNKIRFFKLERILDEIRAGRFKSPTGFTTVEKSEREMLRHLIHLLNGNITAIALRLNTSRPKVLRRIYYFDLSTLVEKLRKAA